MPTSNIPGDRLPRGLKVECLDLVASWLLEEWRATEDDLVRDTDTAYTRGTTRFGRQQKRFWLEYQSGKHPWLRVLNTTLDTVIEINGIPCRFSNDNAESPRKRAVLEVHQHQIPFLEESDVGEAARFVFVIDGEFDPSSDPRVVLLGFSASNVEVCRWTSGEGVRSVGLATAEFPVPIELPKPSVVPKRKNNVSDSDDAASVGP